MDSVMKEKHLSPDREARLIDQVIRERADVDPNNLRPVIDLLSLSMVNGAWRNTCVENWHAGDGPLSDGDMMRINSHTSWRVRQRLIGWLTETEISFESETSGLENASLEDVERLTIRLYGWLTNPRRKLPTGQTLGELAGDQLGDYAEDADAALSAVLDSAEDHGTVFAFKRAAAHGAIACGHWWGHPRWTKYVDAFCAALDDPVHDHWGEG